MALTLQLLVFFIVTSLFAVPFTAALLDGASAIYVAVGHQNYVCDSDSGTYVFSTFKTQLYDASSVDSTDSLLTDVSTIIDHGRNNVKGFGDLSSFIPDVLSFRPAGKTEGVDSTTVQFQISGQSDTVEVEIMEVTIIPGAQSKQGVTLRNNLGITVFVTSPISVEPPVEPAPEPGPPCMASNATPSLFAIEIIHMYGSL